MKNAIILILLVLLAIAWANASEGPRPMIEQRTAAFTRADFVCTPVTQPRTGPRPPRDRSKEIV